MFKKFFMKKMLQAKLKDAPTEQQEKVLAMFEKDPELFEKIAKEIQAKIKHEGKNEMLASMEVMKKYQAELKKLSS